MVDRKVNEKEFELVWECPHCGKAKGFFYNGHGDYAENLDMRQKKWKTKDVREVYLSAVVAYEKAVIDSIIGYGKK